MIELVIGLFVGVGTAAAVILAAHAAARANRAEHEKHATPPSGERDDLG